MTAPEGAGASGGGGAPPAGDSATGGAAESTGGAESAGSPPAGSPSTSDSADGSSGPATGESGEAASYVRNTLDAQDQAAQPTYSNGRQRRENLRRSSALVIGGDQVGRDKFVVTLGDREPAPLQRLSALLSTPVRHAFVEPPDFSRVRAAFTGKRVVILRAAPGQGKVAAAIRLLQSPSDRRIYNLDRNVDLRKLAHWVDADADSDNPLPSGAGFLLCEPVGWRDVQGWVLQQLDVALERLDARLVLTVGTDPVLADQELLEYVVELPRAPEHSSILASHLTWRLDGAQDVAERILADTGLQKLLAELFDTDAPVKRAADLALVISQEFDGDGVDVHRLRDRMAERYTEDFDIWFGGLPDVPTRSLAIALAVLNGLPYENIVRAAERLTERLDGPPLPVADASPMLQPPWRDPFGTTRRQRLRQLRARTRHVPFTGSLGTAQAEIMEYVDEGYAGMVLEHVWRQYQLHRDLLEWLRELADDRTEEVRTWAGTALGLLATYAFDFVWVAALRPMVWEDQNWWLRDVVAYALRVPAADSRLRPLVERAVSPIFGDRTKPVGQATAARIHGVSLGPLDLHAALGALERLAILNDVRIANGIGDSLTDLLLQDEENNAVQVLSRVSSWLHDRRRMITAQWVFLMLANTLPVDIEAPSLPDGPPVSWPMLLVLADQRDDLRSALIAMWYRVLNGGVFARSAERTLAKWAGMAEAHEEVRASLAGLLVATADCGERTEKHLRRLVAGWRDVDNLQPQPQTAYAIEAALDARKDAS